MLLEMLQLVPPMARRVMICKKKTQKSVPFTGMIHTRTRDTAMMIKTMMMFIIDFFIVDVFCLPCGHWGGGGSGTAAAY